MKAKSQLMELSLCLVCALAPASLLSLTTSPSASAIEESALIYEREAVQGKVSAKSELSLTVDGRRIAITPGTSFMKQGKPITFAEIAVGDLVKVVTAKATDGSLQAVSVEVLVDK